jgi:Type IV secretory system Conjugative DNA transfer
LSTHGVVIGATHGRPLIDASSAPVAVLGPCRSGKGVSVLVPSLLTWRGSAIVIDVQGELHSLTSRWRGAGLGGTVRRVDFDSRHSPDSYNFLAEIRTGTPHELGDIEALAEALLGAGPFEGSHAHAALVMLIAATREELPDASLADVLATLVNPAKFNTALKRFRDGPVATDLDRAANLAAAAYERLNEPAQTLVRQRIEASMGIFGDAAVAHNTASSSFTLDDLQGTDRPTTIYVAFSPSSGARLRPLLRAVLAQFVRSSTADHPAPGSPGILMALDAFTTLGRLEFLESALGYLPGYGVKPLLVIEDLSQLRAVYGESQTIWTQCGVRTVLPVNDHDTAVALATEIGGLDPVAFQRMRRQASSQQPPSPTTRSAPSGPASIEKPTIDGRRLAVAFFTEPAGTGPRIRTTQMDNMTDTKPADPTGDSDTVKRSLLSGAVQLAIFAALACVLGLLYNYGEQVWRMLMHVLTLGGFWGAMAIVAIGAFAALAAASHVERTDGLTPRTGFVFFLAYASMGLGRLAMSATFETTAELTAVQATANAAAWVAVFIAAIAVMAQAYLRQLESQG